MLKKLRKLLKQPEGFTLVELMVVLVILGIISGIGIQQYGRIQEQARQSAHEANKRVIRSAAQLWAMSTSKPVADSAASVKNVEDLVDAGYLDAYPKDPWDPDNDESKIYKVGYTVKENGIVVIDVTSDKD
jgi:prepilin-type N-terminal cleavage/methylation domain-containing protein